MSDVYLVECWQCGTYRDIIAACPDCGATESDRTPPMLELVDGEKPDWTDPTSCPYPDCDKRGGQLTIEVHLSEEHGWFAIETDFGTESLVQEREIDKGEQATLVPATDGGIDCSDDTGVDQSASGENRTEGEK